MKKLTFSSSLGFEISASLDLPENDAPRGYAILAHCFTCSKDLPGVRGVARGLLETGLAVLRFDFPGLGESKGAFEETTYSSNVEDLVEAARFLEKNFGEASLLVGHSLGGAACLHAAHRLPSVKAVATIGAPAEPVALTRHFAHAEEEIRKEGAATVKLANRPFTITRQFLEDLEEANLKKAVASLNRPFLILHAPQDQTVGLEHATRLFSAASGSRSFISLDGADHLLTDRDIAAYTGRLIGIWASRFL